MSEHVTEQKSADNSSALSCEPTPERLRAGRRDALFEDIVMTEPLRDSIAAALPSPWQGQRAAEMQIESTRSLVISAPHGTDISRAEGIPIGPVTMDPAAAAAAAPVPCTSASENPHLVSACSARQARVEARIETIRQSLMQRRTLQRQIAKCELLEIIEQGPTTCDGRYLWNSEMSSEPFKVEAKLKLFKDILTGINCVRRDTVVERIYFDFDPVSKKHMHRAQLFFQTSFIFD